MKVPFVYSGNKGISPIIKSQADSLKSKAIELEVFLTIVQGLGGYKKIPIVVSLMGSDIYQSKLINSSIRYFANYR